MYFDWTYLVFIIPAAIIALIAQVRVSSSFNKYSQVTTSRGYTGAQIARYILDANGLQHVAVERVSGSLTDHYDPKANVIRLSDTVYDKTTVAAAGVAAHETGHAIQYAVDYKPIKWRSAIIPITNIGSTLSWPLILLGLLFGVSWLAYIGIILFAFVALFQLITLPVEFNASNRAKQIMQDNQLLVGEEMAGASKVLSAAAMTYVAALITSIANLLRLLVLVGGRRRK